MKHLSAKTARTIIIRWWQKQALLTCIEIIHTSNLIECIGIFSLMMRLTDLLCQIPHKTISKFYYTVLDSLINTEWKG